MVCNLLLAGGKIAVGVLTGSVAITADGMNNLSDASSNIVSLVGFKLGARPADSELRQPCILQQQELAQSVLWMRMR